MNSWIEVFNFKEKPDSVPTPELTQPLSKQTIKSTMSSISGLFSTTNERPVSYKVIKLHGESKSRLFNWWFKTSKSRLDSETFCLYIVS